MKKRWIATLLAGSMFASLTACASPDSAGDSGSAAAADASGDTVKVAAFYNMSGISGDAGAYSKKGWELAVKQINDAGGIKSLGGKKLEIVVGDTMSDATQAKAVAERVLRDDSIVAAIGVGASAQGLPMLPVFEKNNLPFTHNGIGDSFTTQGYTTVFQHMSTGTAWGKAQVQFLQWVNENCNLNIAKVGACYENTENGVSNAKGARDVASKSGFDWAYDETFTAGLSDAAPLVVKMKQSGVQAVLLNGFSQDVKLIINTMKSMNYLPIIFGSGASILFPEFGTDMGDSVEGIFAVGGIPWDAKVVQEQGDEMSKAAAAEYEKMYNEFFCEPAIAAYTGVRIVAEALEAAGSTDRQAVKDAMRKVELVTAEGGPIQFDETGKNLGATPSVSQWQDDGNGGYRLYCVYPENLASREFIPPKMN